ncbi:L-histidine N(alpha)-methyltransferase [Planctomicrobium sp. SH664]|uniref:L-histidine N(alpha)-methyltransferase n=1 Tax=Planctomicrobium sp. SH664 TaxID=3448125 RepID=UPI003F5C02DB
MSLPTVIDQHARRHFSNQFLSDVLTGLARPLKRIPARYLYDARGSELFQQICELEEYYPARTELAIMEKNQESMANLIGSHKVLVELGSGESLKVGILLRALKHTQAYVPIDISATALDHAVADINSDFPYLEIAPACRDYLLELPLPENLRAASSGTVVYYPGSGLGSLAPASALRLLKQVRQLCCEQGGFLVGLDLQQDAEIIERAYNDASGLTAEFNLNLLRRLNRELGATFDLTQFEHRAVYDPQRRRVELRLVSLCHQSVQIGGESTRFFPGEAICTKVSYKFTLPGFARLARRAGWAIERSWRDDAGWFAVVYLTPL